MKVRNRSTSIVCYTVPDLNVKRRFMPGEVKEISIEEITALTYLPGGTVLIRDNLQFAKEDISKIETEEPEREYFYTDEQIKSLILEASLDEFLDALDYAPKGMLEVIKKYAIELPMTDLNKAEALKEKTGFDTLKALNFMKEEKIDSTDEVAPIRKRRVDGETATSGKYKVVNMQK